MGLMTLSMAKADRLRPGTPAYEEQLMRLRRISDSAKQQSLMGGAQVSGDMPQVQGMPIGGPDVNPERVALRAQTDQMLADEAAGVPSPHQARLAAISAQPTPAADAAEAEAARVDFLATNGPGDAAAQVARQGAEAFAADPATAGGRARLAALSAPAALNPIKAEEASTANLDFQTQQDFSGDIMGRVSHEAKAAALKAQTGGGPITVGPADDRSTRWVGQGAGREVAVPSGQGGLDANGNWVAGAPATTKFQPSGPDEVQQQRNQARANVLLGQKAQGAASQAQIDVAKYAAPAAAAGIALTQAQVGMIQNEVERGKVLVQPYQQAAKNPAQLAQLLGSKTPQEQAAAALAMVELWEKGGGDPRQIAEIRSNALSQFFGRPVTVTPNVKNAIGRLLDWMRQMNWEMGLPGYTPPQFTMPVAAPPVAEPPRKR